MEERHRQEMERLKIYYHQQMEETQERCTAEILLLKRRLQELTGTQELFRYQTFHHLTLDRCNPFDSEQHIIYLTLVKASLFTVE